MTVFITSDTTIPSDAVINQDGPGNVVYVDDSTPDPAPSVDLFGAVTGALNSTVGDVITGFFIGGGLYENAIFRIEASGVISIHASGQFVTAYGIRATAWAPDIRISGLVEVTSGGDARGVDVNSPTMNFLNSGHITVSSVGTTFGVRLGNGEDFTNSGTIEVHGGSGPTWGVTVDNSVHSVTNTGSIIVTHAAGDNPSVALATSHFSSVIMEIHNSGLLQADYAVRASGIGASAVTILTNEEDGQIHGAVELSFGADSFFNYGEVIGDVFLGAGNDFFSGYGTLQGVVHGGDGNDIINGHDDDNLLFGDAGNDLLDGAGGTDILDGGAGADEMFGTVDDTASYSSALTGVFASLLNASANTGDASGDIYHFLENLAGSAFDDVLEGDAEANRLSGSAGADTLIGKAGSDTLDGGDGVDTASYATSTASVSINLLTHSASGGDAAGDQFISIENLTGSSFSDTLVGDLGANLLNGGSGADNLAGGDGDDTYVVDDAGDAITEAVNQGVDLVLASLTITLAANVEGLTLTGPSALDGYGNELANLITGNAAINHLYGLDGNDALTGAAGNDALFGGLGIDTANFSGASTGASWQRNTDGTWTVTAGADGTDTTTGVEFLHFGDRDVHLDTAERTYSGDGTSDILFRNTGGAVVTWNVTGTTFGSSAYLATVAPAQWTSLGSGDLNGDGRDEILWRNVSNGGVYSWQTDGAGAITAVGAIANLGAEWSFLGAGDFNGDGKDDLAWRNTNGAVYSWDMNGSTISSSGPLASLGAEWSLKGIGDFNGDGKDDFLWRNSSGGSYIWSMNDRAISVAATSAQAGNDWHIMGVGDFNGDGRDDILWQNDNGQVAEWTMNGATLTSSGFIAVVGPEWHVMGVGDYNGDGKDDILWQNDNGAVYAWMLNGASILQAGAIASVGPEWGII